MDNLDTKFSSEYNGQSYKNFTVNGIVTGVYKNAGSLSYLRIHGAGHMVPAYGVRIVLSESLPTHTHFLTYFLAVRRIGSRACGVADVRPNAAGKGGPGPILNVKQGEGEAVADGDVPLCLDLQSISFRTV